MAHLAYDFLQIRAREALLLEALDSEAAAQTLCLEQRILARPRGRPLDHQSGRKAGDVRLRPHGGLLQ